MKKIKQILKNKRGIALENAILFLLVSFSLCALITTFVIIGRHQSTIENALLLQKIEIEQIGEDFLNAMNDDHENGFNKTYEDSYYDFRTIRREDSQRVILEVWRKTDERKNISLLVEVDIDAEDNVTVLQWRYTPSVVTPDEPAETTAATTVATTTVATTAATAEPQTN